MLAEISYDLIMEDDMDFVEGCYRLEGREWDVLIISKRKIEETGWRRCTWPSGATGLIVEANKETQLNRAWVEEYLSRVLGVSEWQPVQGPDSMRLR